jgi:hypothetical protein
VEGWVRELLGEQTGKQQSCAITQPGELVSKVYCYMGQGSVFQAPANKMLAPGCTKIDDTSSCTIGFGSPNSPVTNYISTLDQHVVCIFGSAERNTGLRYFGIVAGN